MVTVEPQIVDVTRITVSLPNLSPAFDGLTMVQTSDWHLGEWMSLDKMQAIARQVNDLKPDVIVHTGDYVGRALKNVLYNVTHTLQTFEAPEGIFGILGNHDYFHVKVPKVVKAIEEAGNTYLLRNSNTSIRRGDAVLYFAGADDIWEHQQNIDQTLNGIPQNAAVVLLAHEPDFADIAGATGRVGLQLSGHTHGGQVRFPGKGALILPRHGKKYDMGMFNVNGMALYVNRGIGMIPPYVRINCPAEITHITLRATS